MLVRNGHVLAERRKATRRLAPGAVSLPGGHVDAVERWRGEILNQEAGALLWVPLDEPAVLEIDVDRTAVREYLRLARSG